MKYFFNFIVLVGFSAVLLSATAIFAQRGVKPIFATKAHQDTLRVTRFSPNGKLLITGSHDGTVKFWDTSNWHLMRSIKVSSNAVYSLAFSPSQKMLVTVSDKNPIKVWELQKGQHIRSLFSPWVQNTILSVVFSPDERLIATGNDAGKIVLWSTSTWKPTHTLVDTLHVKGETAFSPIWELAFSPNGRFLAVAGGSQSKIWNIKTLVPLAYGRIKQSSSIAFSPNSKLFAVASDSMPITIWNMETGEKLRAPLGNTDDASIVAFSYDSRFLATGGDGVVKLWNTKTWQLVKQLKSVSWIRTLSFSPRGNLLAVGSDDGSLTIWDINQFNFSSK